ncbi:MAG: DNA repair protein RecO [Ferruginibacter sp.]
MSSTFKTKGIVLRSIRYGESSLVVTIFTELFGIQTYMQNGARVSKKGSNKAAMFQPAALLDMEVYHNELKAIHRIKENNWSFLYQHIFSDVMKNCIALYMVELLHKTLKQPESNPELFYFCEDSFQQLDKAEAAVTANFPLFFTIHLTHFLGLRLTDDVRHLPISDDIFLDMMDGNFTHIQPTHHHYLQAEEALITAELLKTMQPGELSHIKLNQQKRRNLLYRYQEFYALHIPDFGQMKTLKILFELLGG